MSPHLADMYDMEEGQKLGVEVADGHIIRVTKTESVNIEMSDSNGKNWKQFKKIHFTHLA